MKTTYLNTMVGIMALTMLAACGDDNNSSGYYINGTNLTGCPIPQGSKNETVVGNLAGSGTLQLDIYAGQSGTIYAIGALSIPNVQALFQGVSLGGYGSGSSYGYGTSPFAPTQTYGATTGGINQCVSTNGQPGTVANGAGAAYQNISNLYLTGPNGVVVQMGYATPGASAYISGTSILGQVVVTIPGAGSTGVTLN